MQTIISVYYVGATAEDALSGLPFPTYQAAKNFALCERSVTIFEANVKVDVNISDLRLVDDMSDIFRNIN